MPTNFWWVFVSFAVVWGVLFGYVARLAVRQQELSRSLRALERERGSTN